MGILDGIVEWLSEQVMHGLDLISTSVLGALGCNMDVFYAIFLPQKPCIRFSSPCLLA